MNLTDFLSGLLDKGIRLWAEGEQLRYRAPTGALTKDIHAVLVERKADLLRFLRLNNQIINAAAPAIAPVLRSDRIPLSFAQERLWFVDQLHHGAAYNMPGVVRIGGALKKDALERAINEIRRRHETLRTIFQMTEEGPVQVICEYEWQALPMVDLTGLGDEERDRTTGELIRAERTRTFDLSKGPVVRVSLLHLAAEEHLILYTMHHITSDGWSLVVLNRELRTLYDAFAQNRPSPLAELPVQYADFTVWQREWLQGAVLEKLQKYWQKQLAGRLLAFRLPIDQKEPELKSSSGRLQSFRFGKELSENIAAFSEREDATLFMVLLTAFKGVLYCRNNQPDAIVGTDVANRNQAGIEGIIGFFSNQLVLRTDLSGNPTLRDMLRRVRETCLAAYVHQDLPFGILTALLNPERNLSDSPLFQAKLGLQNAPPGDTGILAGKRRIGFESSSIAAKFDLLVNIVESSTELYVEVEYKIGLYTDTAIRSLVRDFKSTLNILASQPSLRLNELQRAVAQTSWQQNTASEKEIRKANRKGLQQLKRSQRTAMNTQNE